MTAGERLREDFELAQMGPRVAQNWDSFLSCGASGDSAVDVGTATGPAAARQRVHQGQQVVDADGPDAPVRHRRDRDVVEHRALLHKEAG